MQVIGISYQGDYPFLYIYNKGNLITYQLNHSVSQVMNDLSSLPVFKNKDDAEMHIVREMAKQMELNKK